MKDVTIEELKATAPDLVKSFSNETLNIAIEDAKLIAISDGFPETVTVNSTVLPVLNMATKDMALHRLSVMGQSGRGVTSEKVDVLERHYTDISTKGWLRSSVWGKAYMWLYRRYGAGAGTRVAVIQH